MIRPANHIIFFLFQTITVLSLLVFPSLAIGAEIRYVDDLLIISLRSGPGKDYEPLKTLRTGESMTVIEDQGKFLKVKAEDNQIGWVSKYYTSTEVPKAVILKKLQEEIRRLEEETAYQAKTEEQLRASSTTKITDLTNEIELLREEKLENEAETARLSQELDTITNKHNSLLDQSESIIETSKERNSLKNDVQKIGRRIQELELKNAALADYKMIYWFVAGGGIFLLGWIIGKFATKNKRKTLSL